MNDFPYEDIVGLPHPVSEKHPPMSRYNRAAQFAPFAALTGYGDAIDEAARLTDRESENGIDEMLLLDRRLRVLHELCEKKEGYPSITLTYFEPDPLKPGGKYITLPCSVKTIDALGGTLLTSEGLLLPFGRIRVIEGSLFDQFE